VLDYVGAIVADTDHVAPGGSIDRKYLLGLISDVAMLPARSPTRRKTSWRGGSDERHHAKWVQHHMGQDEKVLIGLWQGKRGRGGAGGQGPIGQPHRPALSGG
jgi:hypothetical protein